MTTQPLTAEHILDTLKGRTVAEAAAVLGVSERTLYRHMRKYGIRIEVQRAPVTRGDA